MPLEVDPTSCEKSPDAVRGALERRPEWKQAFEQETARRLDGGDTEGMVFRDAEGNAFDADNNPIIMSR